LNLQGITPGGCLFLVNDDVYQSFRQPLNRIALISGIDDGYLLNIC